MSMLFWGAEKMSPTTSVMMAMVDYGGVVLREDALDA